MGRRDAVFRPAASRLSEFILHTQGDYVTMEPSRSRTSRARLVIAAILLCGLPANLFATPSWQVAHASPPTKPHAAGCAVCAAAGLSFLAGDAIATAANMHAPNAKSTNLLRFAQLVRRVMVRHGCIEYYPGGSASLSKSDWPARTVPCIKRTERQLPGDGLSDFEVSMCGASPHAQNRTHFRSRQR